MGTRASAYFGKGFAAVLLAALCACLIAVMAPMRANAAEGQPVQAADGAAVTEQATGYITVKDANNKVVKKFGVTNGKDITAKLAEALNYGKGKTCKQTTVTVPAGNYTITTADKLSTSYKNVRVYSNTNLVMGAKTVISVTGSKSTLTNNYVMFEGAHKTSSGARCTAEKKCKHKGYTQLENVTVTGGVIDGNCKANPTWNVSGMNLKHGQNITISNVKFKNFTNHALNVSGTKNTKVTNCTFSDSVKYTGTAKRFWGDTTSKQGKIDRVRSTESVHTDFTNAEGESTAYPLDSTPCVNVTVTGCTFNKTYSGIGTHHECSVSKMKNITVENNTFTLKDGNAVNLFSCSSSTVQKNTVTGGAGLVSADKATVTVTGNKATNCTGNAIRGVISSKLTVTNNTVKKAGEAGILIADKASATVSNNKITSSKKGTGINVSKGKATVKNNTINKGAIGIAFKTPSGACTVSGNKVSKITGDGNGIYVYSAKKGKTKVANNTITSAKEAGIRVDKSKKVTVSGNKVKKSSKFGISVSKSKKVTISDDTLSGGTTLIRAADKCKSTTVENNTLTAKSGKVCKENAILFFNGTTGTVTGNEISGPGKCGVLFNTKCSGTISNNKITNYGKFGILFDKKSSGTTKGNKVSPTGKRAIYNNG